MTTVAIFIAFFGFYLCYCTSLPVRQAGKKMKVTSSLGLEPWAQQQKQPANILGLVLLVMGLVTFAFFYGIGAGTLLFFITLMTVASLIVLLSPLKLINYKILAIAIVSSIVIEFALNIN